MHEEKYCLNCNELVTGLEQNSAKLFCNTACYFEARRNGYRKHSEETKKKIAKSNTGQAFTPERCAAISAANRKKVPPELIERLMVLWDKRYFGEQVICKITGLGEKVYRRLKAQYCKVEQLKFMPQDWTEADFELAIELGNQNVYVDDIAKKIGKGKKQVYSNLKKLGIKPNTHKPNAYSCTSSKLELRIYSWLLELNYDITQQFNLSNFYFDMHIQNTNILIEVNGDYWHCNPAIYTNGPINERQKLAIKRDIGKRAVARKNGYQVVVIWENEVIKNAELAKQELLSKVRKLYEAYNDC